MTQPKVTAIRITQAMEDVITYGKLRANGDVVVRGRAQSEDALIRRGLVEAHDDYLRLTASGRYVGEYILTGGKRRAWTDTELRDAEWDARQGCGAVDPDDFDACRSCADCTPRA